MEEQTGETYVASKYAKALLVDVPKNGKSCFIIGSLLGVLPWQKHGGVVTNPKSLHVIAMDANAMGGVMEFLTKTCGASEEAKKFRIYNMQKDIREVSLNPEGNDLTLYNTFMATLSTVRDRVSAERGVHSLVISSITGLAEALVRSLSGDPSTPGGGMDQDKWRRFGGMINDLRNYAQTDEWHCIWEGHIHKPDSKGQDGSPAKEALLIAGKTGQSFPYNVEQVMRIRRLQGQVYDGTKCDQTFLDTQAASDLITGGRLFTEKLNPKEYDMTVAFHKLGLATGRWGQKAAAAVKSTVKK